MISYTYCDNLTADIHKETIELGDLVQTILGEYGVVIGHGPHAIFYQDKSNYFRVLIRGHIYHYVSGYLKKINKKVDK